MSHPYNGVDFHAHPELYKIDRSEQGIFHVEPYKSELLPLWTIRTLETAQAAANAIYERYLAYKAQDDFVGMDMARKFLQMGYTRARRYANYKGGRKKAADGTPIPFGSGDPVKAEIAKIFQAKRRQVTEDWEYQRLKKHHRQMIADSSSK
ncbi:MAG: DUF4385 domain-containing protein [Cyanobacteria bacterium QS_4_48_99]|nr:MAG: DUF4385 domain-containing protein [Cyanobacteria bacterium QS_4_48_99]